MGGTSRSAARVAPQGLLPPQALLPSLSKRSGTEVTRELQEQAVTLIQCAWRGHAARRSVTQRRIERAVIRLQCAWRSRLARRELQQRKGRDRRKARKSAFTIRHGAAQAEAIRAQAAGLRRRAREQNKYKRYVLSPKRHRWLSWWDLITTLALLYTATLTPFEVAFLSPVLGEAAFADPWFRLNRALDVIFLSDMGLQFFLAYQATNPRTGALDWVDDQRLVVKAYLTSWFGLDAFTLFVPCGFDLYIASDAAAEGLANLSILRVLRILRLIKIVRLVRASRIYQRLRAKVTLSYGAESLLQSLGGTFIAAHWTACVIQFSASMHQTAEETWVGWYGLCGKKWADEHEVSYVNSSSPLGPLAVSSTGAAAAAESPPSWGCEDVSPGLLYVSAISWASMVVTGTGGTDFYPSGESLAETVVVTVLVLLGAFLWTLILARFCDVATNSNPAQTLYRQSLDDLNYFIAVNHVPPEMAQRLREYVHQHKDSQLFEHAAKAVPLLSTALQIEVVLHCHRGWLERVWFLRGLDDVCLVRIAMSMESCTLAPGEVAPMRSLYVVTRGLVLYGGLVLSHGMSWGDDVLLINPDHFAPHVARAMTYVDLHVLSREALHSLVDHFPASRLVIRRAAARLALKRHMLRHYRTHHAKAKPHDDFLDRVHNAAAGLANRKHAASVTIAAQFSQAATGTAVDGALALGAAPAADSAGGADEAREIREEMREEMRELRQDSRAVREELAEVRATMARLAAALERAEGRNER